MSAGKPVNTFQGRRHSHHRNNTIRYLKPETLPTVRREARQTVHLGADWCKTLQMEYQGRDSEQCDDRRVGKPSSHPVVAGACDLLIYQTCA